MFNSSVLDIAIGLVLVYLLISILLTSISEAIEAVLKTRASDLEHALSELFQGDSAMLRSFYEHPLISGLYRGVYRRDIGTAAPAAVAAAAFAGNEEAVEEATPREASTASAPAPQVAPARMDSGGEGHGNLPAYIPREAFSAAMMDLLNSQGAPRLKQAVAALASQQGIDTVATRRAVEGWYDGAMDRASGWFKRRTQRRLFFLGVFIAVIGNVNSVTIAQYLAVNQEAREGLVQMVPDSRAGAAQHGGARAQNAGGGADRTTANEAAANGTAGNGSGDAGTTGNDVATANAMQPASAANPLTETEQRNAWLRDQSGKLQAIGLPIGWSDSVVALMRSSFPAAAPASWADWLRWIAASLILLAGYLATAFAVMLGAPFWFDLLGKLMVVRSTVKPRQKSPDDPPIDGPAPPVPPAPPEASDAGPAPQSVQAPAAAGAAPRHRRRPPPPSG